MNAAATLLVGFLGLFVLGLGLSDRAIAAGDEPEKTAFRRPERQDSHSFGNPEQVRVYQVGLDLEVDFDHRVIHGTAVLDFAREPGCPVDAPLILDTHGLSIESVGLRKMEPVPATFAPTRFQLGPADAILGARLTIDLTPAATQVRIAYRTPPSAGALQWLPPALTAGKVKPFLFTQSEAIHARSWIPLQDSPGVRVTYVATIRVPAGLTAVMAAESRTMAGESNQGVFHFVMAQPIPSYLIALAVGDLAFQPLSERTGVWAEPSVLKSAAYEFGDVEKMVESAERQFGRYRWGRYDILVLPPSFPFGGMENPRLTFATPTVLAGDRSLVSLIAHELAHSWSGNLVTNATWRDFWLNEGFTTYIERRIVEDLYGRDRADMEAVLGLAELRQQLARLPEKDQVLHIDLSGRDPDDGMTQVPYEKGALFLRTLEQTVGRSRFDAFIRAYFDEHVFQSITTADFERYLRDRLLHDDPQTARSIDLPTWLSQPGLPPVFATPRSERLEAIDRTAKAWSTGTIDTGGIDASAWSTQEWLRFLQALPEPLSVDRMTQLDQKFRLTDRGNSEIAHQWLLMAIRAQYKPAGLRLESYLTTIGRRKLVLPLYRALTATAEGRQQAQAIYARARQTYHPITADSIDRLMKEAK
jgi:leukotriene-A4 hydrolase